MAGLLSCPQAEPPADSNTEAAARHFGDLMSTKTFGGLQFWADIRYFDHWRIQKHAWLDTCRLLDPKDHCHCLGSEKECEKKLATKTGNSKLKAEAKYEVVLLLHGIIRTRHSMRPIARLLEQHGFRCYTVSYPSTRLPIKEHAANLHRLISRLDEAEQIHFVCHSMGGLVVRTMLHEHPDPRVKRIVMMGTPNTGAERADTFANFAPYKWIMGPAGQDLVTSDAGIVVQLPPKVEHAEVGIIAGGKGDGRGYLRSLPGDNDGTVTVASTRLAGARDFLLVSALHTFIMNNAQVKQACLNFLKHGYFVSEEERVPIPDLDPNERQATTN